MTVLCEKGKWHGAAEVSHPSAVTPSMHGRCPWDSARQRGSVAVLRSGRQSGSVILSVSVTLSLVPCLSHMDAVSLLRTYCRFPNVRPHKRIFLHFVELVEPWAAFTLLLYIYIVTASLHVTCKILTPIVENERMRKFVNEKKTQNGKLME